MTTVGQLARRMSALPGHPPAFAERALRLARRADSQEYHIAVLGEFKRGKSTLVNALIGREVLPSGAVPVTTVATEVHFDDPRPGARVVFEDGSDRNVATEEVVRFVSESENPANRLGVRRVEVRVPECLGAPGVVLVDTPGIASVMQRQTLAANDALSDSDGAVVVMSVDAPLSEGEEALIRTLVDRHARIFVVLNKADHLSDTETAEVSAFLTRHVGHLLGEGAPVYFLSARRALLAGDRDAEAPADPGFDRFRRDLEKFLRDGLSAERERANVAELARLSAALSEAVAIERAASLMDLTVLHERLGRFRAAGDRVRRAFAEDRVVLDADLARISEAVASALAGGLDEALEHAWSRVESAVAGLRGHALELALDGAIALAVTEAFDPLRRSVERTAEEGWRSAAAHFVERFCGHLRSLRTAASSLFDVHLPEPVPPTVTEQRERFSYSFLQVETPGSSLARTLRSLLPGERARRRALERAHRRLVSELDKHSGRARVDVVQRLDAVARELVLTMSGELEESARSIEAAVKRAQDALESTESAQAAREAERSVALTVVAEVRRLVCGGGTGSGR